MLRTQRLRVSSRELRRSPPTTTVSSSTWRIPKEFGSCVSTLQKIQRLSKGIPTMFNTGLVVGFRLEPLSGDHALAHGIQNQFRRAVDIQLLHEVGTMGVDRMRAQVEQRSDVFCGFQLNDELQQFPFAGGEQIVRIVHSLLPHLPQII